MAPPTAYQIQGRPGRQGPPYSEDTALLGGGRPGGAIRSGPATMASSGGRQLKGGTKSERILRMIIRERSPGDGEALEAIALETHRRDGYPKYLPKDLRSFIFSPEALGAWVAVSDGQVLGHVALHPHGNPQVVDLAVSVTGLDKDDVAVVGRLFVAPSARRQGIGRALLERATEAAVGLRAASGPRRRGRPQRCYRALRSLRVGPGSDAFIGSCQAGYHFGNSSTYRRSGRRDAQSG